MSTDLRGALSGRGEALMDATQIQITSMGSTYTPPPAAEVASPTPLDTARKFDGDKLQYHLLPTEALTGAARAFGFGAQKYAPYNWAKGFSWSRLHAALQRHLMAWWAGEELDPESGLSHLDHALACMMMLATHRELHLGLDDRPTYQQDNAKRLAGNAAALERLK
jgi:hypothetical protein